MTYKSSYAKITLWYTYVPMSLKGLKTCYKVSRMIAKQKKAHTIGENLVLPAAKVMVRCVFGDESVKKLNSISLSNNTVNEELKKCQWIFCSK